RWLARCWRSPAWRCRASAGRPDGAWSRSFSPHPRCSCLRISRGGLRTCSAADKISAQSDGGIVIPPYKVFNGINVIPPAGRMAVNSVKYQTIMRLDSQRARYEGLIELAREQGCADPHIDPLLMRAADAFDAA